MSTRITDLRRLPDFDDTAAKLNAGQWLVYPYEAYGQLDRAEWNDQLVKHVGRHGIDAEVIDIPRKSVAVVVNVAAQPTFDQVTESIAAIDHQRTMGRR